jgi:hypothetical protein
MSYSVFDSNNKKDATQVRAFFDDEIKVAMSVGKDGHLWLKINDEWKRIVTE